jgi:hypothetical protein
VKGELSLDEVWDYWDALEEGRLLLGEVLPLMTLATEIAARAAGASSTMLFSSRSPSLRTRWW